MTIQLVSTFITYFNSLKLNDIISKVKKRKKYTVIIILQVRVREEGSLMMI